MSATCSVQLVFASHSFSQVFCLQTTHASQSSCAARPAILRFQHRRDKIPQRSVDDKCHTCFLRCVDRRCAMSYSVRVPLLSSLSNETVVRSVKCSHHTQSVLLNRCCCLRAPDWPAAAANQAACSGVSLAGPPVSESSDCAKSHTGGFWGAVGRLPNQARTVFWRLRARASPSPPLYLLCHKLTISQKRRGVNTHTEVSPA